MRPSFSVLYSGCFLAVLGAIAGCTGVVDSDLAGRNGNGAGGTDGAAAGNSGGAGTGAGANVGGSDGTCEGTEIAFGKRIIRLTFNQIVGTIDSVLGNALAQKLTSDFQIADATERTFPPLLSTKEGYSLDDDKWQKADAIAQAAGKYVFDNFAAATGCATATDECAQAFIFGLAEKGFRRPLTERDKTALLKVYTDLKTAGGSPQESTQYAVYAVVQSPHFVYRTEFGNNATGVYALNQYELASQLSYFLTDGPPDNDLLSAASQNKLGTTEELSQHVTRLLATDAVKTNLQTAIFAYFSVSRLGSVVIDPSKVPASDFNEGIRNSMYRETELFINNTLWRGHVGDLVTSRTSFINATLAPLYGATPPSTMDADGFGQVELPANRAGLLTNAGFLTSRARTDEQSVVGRGLAVNDVFLCQQNPAFLESLADAIKEANEAQASWSEREKANYRGTTSPCKTCHEAFDPLGLALDNYDLIGRYQQQDSKGRSIDASVTLPASAGGKLVANAVELGNQLGETNAFSHCMATKLITYALAETDVSLNSCASKAVQNAFDKTDKSFASLIKEVAISKALTQRSTGVAQ